MKILIPIFLQILAFGTGIAEAILPSFGLLMVVSLALFGASWWWIITYLNQTALVIFAVANAIAIPFAIQWAIKLMKKSSLSLQEALPSGASMDSEAVALQNLVGLEGVTESFLRPSGKVRVESRLLDAVSTGDFLEKGVAVLIKAVNGSELVVVRKK